MDFNELPAHVWPRNSRRAEDGVVTVAGVPLTELAEDYGTPLYVFDEDDFRSRCRDMAYEAGFEEEDVAKRVPVFKQLYKVSTADDATLVEVNPLVKTARSRRLESAGHRCRRAHRPSWG